eukprot:CAMPEP_0177614688 /NCGR_PEP_ID=MMETSP0419_2-20121207/22889_1 /TAXON_ID=582737 /ORGANISM="Tetraselmis sp., Strain GSL018" /LENGTH=289 /DNA_ID=CAMNT_0019111963 /DNA_START=959 /DNA_END=1826 /DNA_ORIENTATION=+
MKEDTDISFTLPDLVCFLMSSVFCIWYCAQKHWYANNALGLAFSVQGIEHLSLGSVQVGAIMMVGLFVYDIFWVFCTPVMVSVAKSFDAPIKLLFPRPSGVDGRQFSMLGLGDIVVPGLFVALMLRYDVHQDKSTGRSSSYFHSVFWGYVAGLVATILVMNIFEAAQPALLYIVPSVLGAVALHAASRGELLKVFAFEEEHPPEGGEGSAQSEKQADGAETEDKKASDAIKTAADDRIRHAVGPQALPLTALPRPRTPRVAGETPCVLPRSVAEAVLLPADGFVEDLFW